MGDPISGFQDLWEKLRGVSKTFNGANLRICPTGGVRVMLHEIAWDVAVVRHDGCGYSCGFMAPQGGAREGVGSVPCRAGTVITVTAGL